MHYITTFLSHDFLNEPLWMWLMFLGIVLALLVIDLGLFHRKDHEIEVKESLWLSAFYITIGLLFGGWVWWQLGHQKALEYWTGFTIEKTLAMDNIFVIAMIFAYFKIPRLYQHRVLFWGILGVLLLRGLMIGLGTALVHKYEWVLYIFAVFLIYTGIKLLFDSGEEKDIGENAILLWMRRHFRISDMHGRRFFIRQVDPQSGRNALYMTPLFVTLALIEIADVVFAIDSIPAIFAITTDPYIVYTSNIFAILGLRALYFALAALLHRFIYLNYALSVLLIFIGSKIFIADLLGMDKFPPGISLTLTIVILAAGIICSWVKTRKDTA